MNYILEHLAIGNSSDAQTNPHPFGAFLNVASEIDPDVTPPLDKPYLHIPLEDMHSIPVFRLQQAVDFIDAHIQTQGVLVYCEGGVGPSPSIVVAYLCSKGMRFGQAVEFVAVRKPYMSILPELYDGIQKAFRKPPPPILPTEHFALPSHPVRAMLDIFLA